MVSDEWSKKVTRGIQQLEIQERKMQGENITAGKQVNIQKKQTVNQKRGRMQRFDSKSLNQITANSYKVDSLKKDIIGLTAKNMGLGHALNRLKSKEKQQSPGESDESESDDKFEEISEEEQE